MVSIPVLTLDSDDIQDHLQCDENRVYQIMGMAKEGKFSDIIMDSFWNAINTCNTTLESKNDADRTCYEKIGQNLEKSTPEHELDCSCNTCYEEFASDGAQNKITLKAAKLLKLAEKIGSIKATIHNNLKNNPNYNTHCNCKISSKGLLEPICYNEEWENGKHRDVCLRCGGMIGNYGILNKCPKCNTDNISAGDWDTTCGEAICTVSCQECDCRWWESFTNATWELQD